MSFVPGASNGVNIGSVYYGDSTKGTKNILYIGSTFNLSVVSLKCYIGALSYEMGKETQEEQNHTQNYFSFASFNGTFAIKISLDVPSATAGESKNNLAKISHLQTMILSPEASAGSIKSHQIIYLSNIINNGKQTKSDFEPETITQLALYGLTSWISEIKYEPDFSQGFHKSGGELYPKYYRLDLTINPDTTFTQSGNLRKFLDPFFANGQYSNQDSTLFPFLIPAGSPDFESSNLAVDLYNSDLSKMIEMDQVSQYTLNSSKDSMIYIALPIDKPRTETTTTDSGIIKRSADTDPANKIRRQLVFYGFIDSFSRTFKTDVKVHTDESVALVQELTGYGSKLPVQYSFSFSVPSSSLIDAKRNAAKIQYIMRMFYTRKKQPPNTNGTDAEDAKFDYSLRVFLPSFLGKKNTMPETLNEAYNNSYILQTKNISIEMDISQGFFTQGRRLYPKAFKVNFDMIDSEYSNQRKITSDGKLEQAFETRTTTVTETDDDGEPILDENDQPKKVEVTTSTPVDDTNNPLSNIKDLNNTDYVSNIKYWSPN